ncbi:monocarboxylate transporter 12-like isoform X2 [Ornithodoros turicata]
MVHHFSMRSLCAWATLFGSIAVFICRYATTIKFTSVWLGVVQGVCTGFHYTLTSPLVASHFKRHSTTAIGILYAGPAIGSFIFPPFFSWTYQQYGLRGVFLIFSGITLNALPFVLLMGDPVTSTYSSNAVQKTKTDSQSACLLVQTETLKKRIVESDSKNETTSSSCIMCACYKDACKSSSMLLIKRMSVFSKAMFVFGKPMFYVIGVSNVVIGYNNTTVLNVLIDFAIDQKVRPNAAVFLLTSYGVGDLVGRLGSGWITDRGYLSRCKMMMLEAILLGTLLVGLSQTRGLEMLMAVTFAFGCASGSTMVLFTDLLKDYLGSEWIALASGWMFFFGGLVLMTRPMVIGYFRDSIGSYETMFILQGISCILCGVMWAVIALYEVWKAKSGARTQRATKIQNSPSAFKNGVTFKDRERRTICPQDKISDALIR